jgi:uncharacterized membrane-anchored protein
VPAVADRSCTDVPRQFLVPLLLTVVVVVSGCGGGGTPSVQELERSIVSTRDRVDFVLARITQAQSKDELLERMQEAAAAIEAAAGDLDRGGASTDYESDVAELVDSLRQLAFDLEATAEQIGEPGFGDLLTGAKGLSFESWDRVNLALASLQRKGIDVAPLERH